MERIKKYEPLWGKWRVKRKIDERTFGTVYEVEKREEIDGKVTSCAVQLMLWRISSDSAIPGKEYEKLLKKSLRMPKLMEKLQSRDHIVTIYDYEYYIGEGMIDVLIRMELLENLDMSLLIKSGDSEEELKEQVLEIGIEVCKALEECEDEKIVHCNIKPHNIFINKNNTIKLGGFELAYELPAPASLGVVGTPMYMAPEAFKRGECADYCSDIYSLGIVMYQLLNDGNIPFAPDMESYDEIYDAIGKRADGEEIPAPRHDQGELWKVIQKACQYKKEDRYQSAIEMRKDLEKLKYRKVNNYNIGDSLFFGSYPQDADGTEKPIEWIILKKEGDKVLLLSKYILDAKPYNNKFEEVTWETSDIRRWLNNKFYTNAFNESEQEKIHNGFIKTENNPRYRTNGGNDTEDKVFLLSIKEVEILLPNDKGRKAKATEYAQKMGSYVGRNTGDSVWWLRSPGYDGFCAVVMQEKYALTSEDGDDVNRADDGVRPVLWLSIES